jgi:hypothetical protein
VIHIPPSPHAEHRGQGEMAGNEARGRSYKKFNRYRNFFIPSPDFLGEATVLIHLKKQSISKVLSDA